MGREWGKWDVAGRRRGNLKQYNCIIDQVLDCHATISSCLAMTDGVGKIASPDKIGIAKTGNPNVITRRRPGLSGR
jgi:hypothetical protein